MNWRNNFARSLKEQKANQRFEKNNAKYIGRKLVADRVLNVTDKTMLPKTS